MAEVTNNDFKEAIKTIAMYYRKVTQRKECVDFYVKFIEPIKKEVYLQEGEQANSEKANCAIFDVSKILPSDELIDNIVHEDFTQSEMKANLTKKEKQIALAGMRAGAKKLKDWIEGNFC